MKGALRGRLAVDAGLLVAILAALAWLAWPALQDGPEGPAPEPPRATFSTSPRGIAVGRFASGEVDAFLRGQGLPALERSLPALEAGVARALEVAMADLGAGRCAGSMGRMGHVLAFLERRAAAAACYAQAAEIEPDDPRWLLALGRMAAEQGDPLVAERSLRRAAELDMDGTETHLALARHLLETDRSPAAEKVLRDLSGRLPQLGAARLELARIALERGDAAGAMQELESIVPPVSEGGKFHALAARVRAVLGDSEDAALHARLAKEAIESLTAPHDVIDDAVLRASGSLALARREAQAAFHAADWPTVISRMQEILRRDPTNPQERLQLGLACFEAGRREEAHEEVEKALAQDPEDPELVQGRAFLAFREGDHEAAVRWAEEASRLGGGARPRLIQALSLASLGRLDEAVAAAREASRLAPGDRDVQGMLRGLETVAAGGARPGGD